MKFSNFVQKVNNITYILLTYCIYFFLYIQDLRAEWSGNVGWSMANLTAC